MSAIETLEGDDQGLLRIDPRLLPGLAAVASDRASATFRRQTRADVDLLVASRRIA